jgi:hypothetical protein
MIATLEHLSLGGNYFDGTIPAQYGSFPALQYLGLSGNSLTGPIPPELGKLQGNGAPYYSTSSVPCHHNMNLLNLSP